MVKTDRGRQPNILQFRFFCTNLSGILTFEARVGDLPIFTQKSEHVLNTFVSCVYDLAINPESQKTKTTSDNVHYLALMAEEFPAVETENRNN